MRQDARTSAFDPASAVRFDLGRGQVELSDGEPHLLVPVSALASLAAGGTTPRALGRAIGVGLLGRVARRLGADPADPRGAIRERTLGEIVGALGTELAVLGLGNLTGERWGDVMCFLLDPCTLDPRADAILEGLLEGSLGSVTDLEIAAAVIERKGSMARLLVGAPRMIEWARDERGAGASFADIVAALHMEPGA